MRATTVMMGDLYLKKMAAMKSKVLLIDDDIELVGMFKEYLEQEGFEVKTVHDGEAGTAEAFTGLYSIAILDVMMPRMNGLETLRRIRTSSQLPILMLTGRGDDTDRIVGLELGADDYVAKPCTPRELTARIRAILRRAQSVPADTSQQTAITVGQLTMWPEQRRATWASTKLRCGVQFAPEPSMDRPASSRISQS